MTDPVTGDRAVREYCDRLLVALRVKDVPGQRIGAVLAEVRAHVADSGEDPTSAFGPPEEYAAALTAGAPPEPLRRQGVVALYGAALCLGCWWLVTGVAALATGEVYRLGPLPLVVAALVGLAAPWLVGQLTAESRAARVRGAAAVVLGPGTFVALALWAGDAGSVPVPAALPAALGVLLVAIGWFGLGSADDPVTDPFEDPDTASARHRREAVRGNVVLWGTLAVMAAGAVVLAVLVERAA